MLGMYIGKYVPHREGISRTCQLNEVYRKYWKHTQSYFVFLKGSG